MNQIYKIFYDKASIHIVPESEFQRYKNSGFYEFKDVKDHLDKLLNDNIPAREQHAFIKAGEPEKSFEQIKSHFIFIEAAGGIVRNEFNEILTMVRRGKNDLPKGKCEKNESVEQTALREVQEECGVENLTIDSFLMATYHIYPYKGSFALKKTWWYNMKAPKQKLLPQTEEDITEVKWLPQDKLNQFETNTFPTLIDVLQDAKLR